jgi:hypothetical protein
MRAIQWVRLQRRQKSSTPPATRRASRLPQAQRQSSAGRAEAGGCGGAGVMKLKMDFDFDAHCTPLGIRIARE